jgi:hypothetical protein
MINVNFSHFKMPSQLAVSQTLFCDDPIPLPVVAHTYITWSNLSLFSRCFPRLFMKHIIMPPSTTIIKRKSSSRPLSRRREVFYILVIAALTLALIRKAPKTLEDAVKRPPPPSPHRQQQQQQQEKQNKVIMIRANKNNSAQKNQKTNGGASSSASTTKASLYNNQRRNRHYIMTKRAPQTTGSDANQRRNRHYFMNKRSAQTTASDANKVEVSKDIISSTSSDAVTPPPAACGPLQGRNLPNFYVHIPKVAGNSAHKLISDDLQSICGSSMTACNHHTEQASEMITSRMSYWQQWMRQPCSLHISESLYIDSAQHAFTVIRDPTHHVVSQYFHCKESDWRKETWRDLPDFTEWLEYWIDQRNMNTSHLTNSSYPLLYTYDCYKPINLQSSMVGGLFNLTARFDVIGMMSKLLTTTCLISIQLLGVVPSRCDCTNNSTTMIDKKKTGIPKIDHGTKHHGESYQLTDYQRELISSLTDQDAILYEIAQESFQRRVNEVEKEYKITLC